MGSFKSACYHLELSRVEREASGVIADYFGLALVALELLGFRLSNVSSGALNSDTRLVVD